jgi:Ca-activated chloride channel family protein
MRCVKRYLLAGACVILLAAVPTAAAADPDALYRQGRFAEAEKAYAVADMDRPREITYRFNKGCAAYQAGNYEAAFAAFSSVLGRAEARRPGESAPDKELLFRGGYNLGCAAFKKGDYAAAVSGFRKALMHRPENPDARHNLELALRELEKQKDRTPGKPKDAAPKDRGDQKREDSTSSPKGNEKGEREPDAKDQASNKEERPDQAANQKGSGQREDHGQAQDLSGDLTPLREGTDQAREGSPMDKERQMIDRKRAEALLDNIRENPLRALRHQRGQERARAPLSGKDW